MLILILIGIVPSMIAAYLVVRSYEERAVSLRMVNVRNQCEMLCNSLVAEQYFSNPGSEVINSQLDLLSNIYSGRILIVDSDFRVIHDTFDLDTGRTSVTREVITCFRDMRGETLYDSRNAYIEITLPITEKGADHADGVLLASVSTNEIVQGVRLLENRGVTVIAAVSLLVLIGGYFLAGFLVKPFLRVTRAIEDVTDGMESEAISVPDYTETQQITDAFNQMLARVSAMDNSRQEFVSNVSHELKTPLTSMKVLADSLNSMENVPVEIYRDFMQDITSEIDRENSIITDLLSMVRLDKKAGNMHVEETEIGELLEDIFRRLRPIAAKRSIELMLEKEDVVMAEVDATKLALAFTNLIENGIKYNIEEGWVRVSLTSDRKYFYVDVEDCGIGIPESQIEHIFERFYRVDKSHSTEIEGTGLGLAIVRQTIALHHGVIRVSSKEKEGTLFQVRIPLKYE